MLFYTGPVLTMNSFVEKEKEKENKIIGCSNQWTCKKKNYVQLKVVIIFAWVCGEFQVTKQ